MLFVGLGKIVRAAEILFRAHIEIVVMHAIEHGIDAGHRRYAYRTGRQTGIAVGVVGTVDGKQICLLYTSDAADD